MATKPVTETENEWLSTEANDEADQFICFRAARDAVDMPALIVGRDTRNVRLVNVSPFGAAVRGRRAPAKGETIVLTRNSIKLRANVRWIRGTLYGLKFENRLEQDTLQALKMPHPQDGDKPGLLRRLIEVFKQS